MTRSCAGLITAGMAHVSLPGTGAKAGQDIITGRREKIAVGVVHQAGARRPGAAFEHLAIAKPGGGVLPIRIVHQIAREGIKGRLGPLPDIAGHLTAAEGAIASRKGTDVDTAQEARVQIGLLWGWRRIAPGIAALVAGKARAISARLGTGGEFPLGLGRQASTSPVTVRFGPIP